jgi:hypothetical protein
MVRLALLALSLVFAALLAAAPTAAAPTANPKDRFAAISIELAASNGLDAGLETNGEGSTSRSPAGAASLPTRFKVNPPKRD